MKIGQLLYSSKNLFVAKSVIFIFTLLLCAHFNMPSARMKRLRDKEHYASNKQEICASHRNYYAANADKCKEASKQAYEINPEKKKTSLPKSLQE